MLENLTRILRNLNSLYLNSIGHQHISDIIFLYIHVIRVCGKSINWIGVGCYTPYTTLEGRYEKINFTYVYIKENNATLQSFRSIAVLFLEV